MIDPAPAPGAVSHPAAAAGAGRRPVAWPVGPARTPGWARWALLGVLAVTALLYTWRLSRNGDANAYYSAAVLSATKSWKAFFFGSLDTAGFITVDKPPLALWVQSLSARVFGFGPWAVLLPQAAAGVAAAGVVALTVRRAAGPVAAVAAAAVLALTPITVAINRDNNPDTLLVLCLVAAAAAVTAGLSRGRWTPLLTAGAFIGVGFNTKLLEAWLVLPGLALAYLVAGPPRLRTRLLQLLAAGGVMVAVSSLWILAVDLTPATSRPYVGGSRDNTALDLVLGYNGGQRLFGPNASAAGAAGGGGPLAAGGISFGGPAGWGRLFNAAVGAQVSWLVPLALLVLAAGLVARRRAARTDGVRAALLLWGGWLVVSGVVFSLAGGTFHPYYTTLLAPAIAGLVGVGGVVLTGELRRGTPLGWVLPAGVAGTGVWATVLVRRHADYHPWLTATVIAVTAVAVALLTSVGLRRRARGGWWLGAAAVTGAAAILLAPGAYAVSTAAAVQEGTNPTAGPATRGFPGGPSAGGPPGPGAGVPDLAALEEMFGGRLPPGFPGSPPGAGGVNPGFGPGVAGPGGANTADPGLVAYLRQNRGGRTWLAATSNANTAAAIILATGGEPVMAAGGFLGTDPALTEADLRRYVAGGRLRYVVTSPMDALTGSSVLVTWAAAHCRTVNAAVYHAAGPAAPGGGPGGASTLYDCAG